MAWRRLLLLLAATLASATRQFGLESQQKIDADYAQLTQRTLNKSAPTVGFFGQRKQFQPPTSRCSTPCRSADAAQDADILFLSTSERSLPNWKKKPHQRWVAINTEALPEFVTWLARTPQHEIRKADMRVDWTMDYRRTPRPDFWLPWLPCRKVVVGTPLERIRSNVPSPIKLWHRAPDGLPAELVANHQQRPADFAAFISNASPLRERIVSELSEFFRIDHFGKSRRNRKVKAGAISIKEQNQRTYNYTTTFESKIQLASHYRFTLAFDSTDQQDDWVTEKVYHALAAHSLPVYFGARNIEHFLPCRHCVVHVREHALDEAILLLQHLNTNKTAYLSYFSWLHKPVPPHALELERYCRNNDGLEMSCMACARHWNGDRPLEAQRLENYGTPIRHQT